MTRFFVIYLILFMATSYLLTRFFRDKLNLNFMKEITKKPRHFLFSGIESFVLNALCGVSTCIALTLSNSIGISLFVLFVISIICLGIAVLSAIKIGKKYHILLTLPLPVASYAAMGIMGTVNTLGIIWFLGCALLNSFLYAVSNLIFTEVRDRIGIKPAPIPMNRQIKDMRAQVMCSGTYSLSKPKYLYQGIDDCHAAMSLYGGNKFCESSCLGCGSCVSSCKFNAIVIIDGIATVNTGKCTGCGVCAKSCPKNLIYLIPRSAKYWVGCSSTMRSGKLCEQCRVGCTACGECVKVCRSGAIVLSDHKALIDYDKCDNCGKCAEICPRKTIWSL